MKVTITIEIDEKELSGVLQKNSKGCTPDGLSDYARVFNDSIPAWTKDQEYNLMYLRNREHYANDMLKIKGYLFLNEVYDMIGIPRTKAGNVVGWIYDEDHPNGDNFVDFGLADERNYDFMNGITATAILDFNVDGEILSKL